MLMGDRWGLHSPSKGSKEKIWRHIWKIAVVPVREGFLWHWVWQDCFALFWIHVVVRPSRKDCFILFPSNSVYHLCSAGLILRGWKQARNPVNDGYRKSNEEWLLKPLETQMPILDLLRSIWRGKPSISLDPFFSNALKFSRIENSNQRFEYIGIQLHISELTCALMLISGGLLAPTKFPDDERFKLYKVYRKWKQSSPLIRSFWIACTNGSCEFKGSGYPDPSNLR